MKQLNAIKEEDDDAELKLISSSFPLISIYVCRFMLVVVVGAVERKLFIKRHTIFFSHLGLFMFIFFGNVLLMYGAA